MKQLSAFVLLLTCLLTQAQDTIWQKPITISKGGVYKGNFKGDGINPTILVTTSEPVTIYGSGIIGVGNQPAIKAYGYTSLYIHHNKIDQQYGTDGGQRGKAMNIYRPRYLKVENNEINGSSGAVYVDHMDDTPLADSIIIRYNVGRNMSKATYWGSTGPDHAQFIQFNTVRGFKYAEIAWNECINEPDKSWVEDNISIINSKGKEPILIHNNYLNGAYPIPADQEEGFTGSGITVETNNNNEYSDGVLITDNQVVSMGNACLNITSSAHVIATRNRLISASTLPNGSKPRYFWSGTWLGNGSGLSEELLATSSIKGNVIGYARYNDAGNQYPYFNRQDQRALYGNTNWGDNRMKPGDNTYLPDAPITKAMEANEWTLWVKKLQDNKIFMGHDNKIVVISTPNPPASGIKKIFFTATSKGIKYDLYTDGSWKAKDGSTPPVPVKVTTTIEVSDDGTIKIKKQ